MSALAFLAPRDYHLVNEIAIETDFDIQQALFIQPAVNLALEINAVLLLGGRVVPAEDIGEFLCRSALYQPAPCRLQPW